MSDMYDEIANQSAASGGNYIRAGRYTLLVTDAREHRGAKGQSLIGEMVVVKSEPSGLLDENGQPIAPNAPQTTCSEVCTLGGDAVKRDMAMRRWKGYVLGILEGRGATERDVTGDVLRAVVGPSRPLRGMIVACETRRTTTKAGKVIDVPMWRGIAQTKEEIAKWRAMLDARGSAPAPDRPTAATPVVAPTSAPERPERKSFLDGLE